VKLLNAGNLVLVIAVGDPHKKVFADDALGLFVVKIRFPMLGCVFSHDIKQLIIQTNLVSQNSKAFSVGC